MSRLLQTLPHKAILSLWFDRLKTKDFREAYFKRDAVFDTQCKEYEPYITTLIREESKEILKSDSRDIVLASILLVDQFSRNIWRGKQAKDVYTKCDPVAQKLSLHYIDKEWHKQDDWASLAFVLLPFEHSENRVLHLKGISIWTDFMSRNPEASQAQQDVLESFFKIQLEHYSLVTRFGRYPHRVEIVGGTLTDEEKKLLDANGAFFGTEA